MKRRETFHRKTECLPNEALKAVSYVGFPKTPRDSDPHPGGVSMVIPDLEDDPFPFFLPSVFVDFLEMSLGSKAGTFGKKEAGGFKRQVGSAPDDGDF